MVSRNVALLNVGTFVLFRIVLLGLMARWLIVNKDALPLLLLSMVGTGLAVILGLNAVLFYRILNRDFFWNGPTAEKSTNSDQKIAAGADADNVLLGGDRD